MERKFTSDALQAIYLQFRDNDNWYTVRDYNPSSKFRLLFYDNRVKEYINLDLLDLRVSYSDKRIGFHGNVPEGVLVRDSIIDRLRLALRVDDGWMYMTFNIEKMEGRPVLTQVKVEMTDKKVFESIGKIEMNDQTLYEHG